MDVHVKTGDSSNCTNLSIWINIFTVISSSALVVSVSAVVTIGNKYSQDLKKIISLLISLSKQTE